MEKSDHTCLDQYLASFEESLASRNYKPDTLKNYRYLLRRFGRLLDDEATLIETAKLNTVDPHAWLANTLARIPDDKITKVGDLLRWRWYG
ncbi:transposase domain-containing protein [Paracoccus sp. R12_1]|nr:transposase domain-containing protein [Paracoccus sp. R12_2]MBO9487268.1 transposase domain-containing protein [Paracoccus sp. R12_1]